MTGGRPPARRCELRMLRRPVHAWVTAVDPEIDLSVLSASERAVHERLPGPADRARYATGRVLTRYVLGRELGLAPGAVPIALGDFGRPGLDPRTAPARRAALDFNLSHCGGYVALAVARGLRVGVDIERIEPRENARGIATRYFSPAESELLDRSGARRHDARWYRIWTTREAHAKARGVGVRGIGAALSGHGERWERRGLSVARGYTGSVVALPPADRPVRAPRAANPSQRAFDLVVGLTHRYGDADAVRNLGTRA